MDDESRIKAFENGGVDFICKPYNQVELLKRIEVHLKLKLIQDELKAKNKPQELVYLQINMEE